MDESLAEDNNISPLLLYMIKDMAKDVTEVKQTMQVQANSHAEMRDFMVRINAQLETFATHLELQPVSARAKAAHDRMDKFEARELDHTRAHSSIMTELSSMKTDATAAAAAATVQRSMIAEGALHVSRTRTLVVSIVGLALTSSALVISLSTHLFK